MLDIAKEPGYFNNEDLTETGVLIVKTFQMLSIMIVYQTHN